MGSLQTKTSQSSLKVMMKASKNIGPAIAGPAQWPTEEGMRLIIPTKHKKTETTKTKANAPSKLEAKIIG